jgi:hypothetical protein
MSEAEVVVATTGRPGLIKPSMIRNHERLARSAVDLDRRSRLAEPPYRRWLEDWVRVVGAPCERELFLSSEGLRAGS